MPISLIQSAKTITLFGHEYIDGDCIGSMLALGSILEKLGKKVSYYTPIAPDSSFNRVPSIQKIQTQINYNRKSDLHIFIDFTEINRIQGLQKNHEKYFDKIPTIVIDHHPGKYEKAKIIIKDTTASSCAERLLEHIQKRGRHKYITPRVATYLYLGIVMDTGNFLFDRNSPRTLSNAATLMKYGANKDKVTFHMFRNRSFNTMKYLQTVLNRLQVDKKTNILRTYTTQTEKEELQLSKNDEEYAQFTIQQIAGHPLTIIFKILPYHIKISFRSRSPEQNNGMTPILANRIARLFNGGGHDYAAGAKIKRKDQDIIIQIKNILQKIGTII